MRRWLIILCYLSLFFGGSVYAHLSGAFGDFLIGIQDESTTQKLKNEIEETKEQIEQLTPKVNRLQSEYSAKEKDAVTKLLFYNTMGLDVFMNFVLETEGIVDSLANKRLYEKNIETYLQELNHLYLKYKQLEITQEALEGHQELLMIIENNLSARNSFFEKYDYLSDKDKAYQAVEEFELVMENITDMLYRDSDVLNSQITRFVTRKTKNSPYRLDQHLYNKKSEIDYYFRSDHTYLHVNENNTDVILIGVFTKDNSSTASLKLEAGFSNGIMIPEEVLPLLGTLKFDYSKLNSNSKDFFIEQTNGAIIIQSNETAVE